MKIHIFGAPGSGKSYIAAALSTRLGIPHLALDDIFWDHRVMDYACKADGDDRDKMLVEFLKKPHWIVEGSYHKWVAPSFNQADIIVVLSVFIWLRHWRILLRSIKRKLTADSSESLAAVLALLKYNHHFDQDRLIEAKLVINECSASVITVSGLEEVFAVIEST